MKGNMQTKTPSISTKLENLENIVDLGSKQLEKKLENIQRLLVEKLKEEKLESKTV